MHSLPFILIILVFAITIHTSHGECYVDGSMCKPNYRISDSKYEICRKVRAAVKCFHDLVMNKPDCSQSYKETFKAEVNKINKKLSKLGCSGAMNLMPSLILCLGLSIVAYFLTALK